MICAETGNTDLVRRQAVLDATPDAPRNARRFALEAVQPLASGHAVRDDVALAVSEAVTNVVMHAYRDPHHPGKVVIEAESGDDAVLLKVRDDGMGMRPGRESRGLGFGLALMERVTSHLDVRPGPAGGTEVQMLFSA